MRRRCLHLDVNLEYDADEVDDVYAFDSSLQETAEFHLTQVLDDIGGAIALSVDLSGFDVDVAGDTP